MILLGDCLEQMKTLADNSVDAVVTDPPYGLRFMNKHWDYDVPGVETWQEVLRVLKPGGHLLSFGGTRTYHRMACAIEDAGFEIRDCLQWIYGSGFPKSQDISKAIDKQAGVERDVVCTVQRSGSNGAGGTIHQSGGDKSGTSLITAPATRAAKQWQGWGTALKPANEPICLARKPLEAKLTVAGNVLKHGTGGLNIDESRIEGVVPSTVQGQSSKQGEIYGADQREQKVFHGHSQGRWPANVLFDEAAAAVLDQMSGVSPSNARKAKQGTQSDGVTGWRGTDTNAPSDTGGASRFFYVAKTSKSERNAGLETAKAQNFHPCVKPLKLMEYLIKLICPPGGIILDPFCGSGSTLVAAKRVGFKFIGIEMNADYIEIAEGRLAHARAVGEK